MPKRALREEARAIRRAIPAAERDERDARIREQALALPELARARVVGCYVSVGSEVGTTLLLRALLAKGIVVAVPVTEGDHLRFVRLDHPWALAPGAHGIPEPREPRTDVPGEDLEVVLVPGLRFGRDGSRLGNGRGHFDRFLAEHPKAKRVALAFREQVVDSVATEAHDQPMDVIVTEDGRVRTGRPGQAP
jgi:5-formyltetrahydrofolate cyclo-ligase